MGARDERVEVVDGHRLVLRSARRDRDDLLREDVERIAWIPCRLDLPFVHRA